MSNHSSKYERRCRCGKKFETTDTEMAEGSGRYCSAECLEKFLEDHEGKMYLFDYKPRGAPECCRSSKSVFI